jgi:plastocyanin
MRNTVRLILAISLAAVFGAPALTASAATQAAIVNCGATPSPWCFSPATITVGAGTSVTWTNNTSAPHTATADNNAWTTATVAGGGTSTAITFATPGTFPYHCAIHPSMHGSVVVTAAATAPPTPAVTPKPSMHALATSGGGPALPLSFGLGVAAVAIGLALLARRRTARR